MATFSERIQAMTGYDADSSSNAFDSTTFQTLTSQWLTDGAREVINTMPAVCLPNVAKQHTLTNSEGFKMDQCLILEVMRNDGNIDYSCRRIGSTERGKASSGSGFLEEATNTDPIYYILNNVLFVLPTPTTTYKAILSNIEYPTIDYSDSVIVVDENLYSLFPKEIENLVVLYASSRAAEYLLATEEDVELYVPMIASMKQDYKSSFNAYLSRFGSSIGGATRIPSAGQQAASNPIVSQPAQEVASQTEEGVGY